MTDKEWNRIGGIVIISICFIGIAIGFYRTHQLILNHKITSGYVLECTGGGGGNSGYIHFDFKLDGRNVKTTCGVDQKEIDIAVCETYFAKKHFPVVYNPDNPSNAQVLILPDDFEKFGYSFPDSLKWVLTYMR